MMNELVVFQSEKVITPPWPASKLIRSPTALDGNSLSSVPAWLAVHMCPNIIISMSTFHKIPIHAHMSHIISSIPWNATPAILTGLFARLNFTQSFVSIFPLPSCSPFPYWPPISNQVTCNLCKKGWLLSLKLDHLFGKENLIIYQLISNSIRMGVGAS